MNKRRLGRIRLREDPMAEPPISKLGFDTKFHFPFYAYGDQVGEMVAEEFDFNLNYMIVEPALSTMASQYSSASLAMPTWWADTKVRR